MQDSPKETPIILTLPIRVDQLPKAGARFSLDADARDYARLAAAIGVDAVSACRADFVVTPRGSGAHVGGEVSARVTQICGVTLEPFETEIREPLDVTFATDKEIAAIEKRLRALQTDEAASLLDDLPDPLRDDKIDLGAVAQEFLTLAIDPYPRKPGVAFSGLVEDAGHKAFAALAQMQVPKDKKD